MIWGFIPAETSKEVDCKLNISVTAGKLRGEVQFLTYSKILLGVFSSKFLAHKDR